VNGREEIVVNTIAELEDRWVGAELHGDWLRGGVHLSLMATAESGEGVV
jgi:hypothetical protein